MTAEQNLRRAMIDNLPRERMVEAIAKHLFRASRGFNGTAFHHALPQDWYRASYLTKKVVGRR